jgi:hypothetical protein
MTDETTIEHVVYGALFAREVGRRMGLPVVFCAAPVDLKPQEAELDKRTGGLPVLWLTRLLKKPWEVSEPQNS